MPTLVQLNWAGEKHATPLTGLTLYSWSLASSGLLMLPGDLIRMLYFVPSFIFLDEHCMLSPLSANLQYLTPYFLSYVVTLLLFHWVNKSNQKIFPQILIITCYQDPLGTIYSIFSPVPMDEISVLLVKAISSIRTIDLTSFCLLKNITLAIVPSLFSHHQILATSTESISLMYNSEVNSSNLNKNFGHDFLLQFLHQFFLPYIPKLLN